MECETLSRRCIKLAQLQEAKASDREPEGVVLRAREHESLQVNLCGQRSADDNYSLKRACLREGWGHLVSTEYTNEGKVFCFGGVNHGSPATLPWVRAFKCLHLHCNTSKQLLATRN